MISVVIPTLNAEAGLAAALTALVPAVVDGLVRDVVVVDGGSRDRTLAIAEKAGCDIVRLGQSGRGAPSTPSALVVGSELYFVSDAGIATCADAKTGQVFWNERLGGGFSASPVFADGRIYFQNEEGVGYVLKAGKVFELLAKNELGERTLASCAVTDGAMYIRGAQHLFRIGNK